MSENKRFRPKRFEARHIFYICYGVGALGMAVLGLLSNAFFAYGISEELWAAVLYALFVSMLYIAAFVREVIDSRKPADIIFNSAAFIGSLLFFLLFYFLGRVFIFIATLYSGIMLIAFALRAIIIIRKTSLVSSVADIKPFIAIVGLLLYTMIAMFAVEYENDLYLAWALIPTAAVSLIVITAGVILWKDLIAAKLLKKLHLFFCALSVFIVAFVLCFTAIGAANVVFDGNEPTPIKCTVLEKRVSSGTRTPITHEFKVSIDGCEMWINVSPTEYFEIPENSEITVDRYSGAFGFAYYLPAMN